MSFPQLESIKPRCQVSVQLHPLPKPLPLVDYAITSAILDTQVLDCCTHPLEVTDKNLKSLSHTEALHLSGSSIRLLFSMTIGKSYLCELMVGILCYYHAGGVVVHVQIRASPRHCYSSFFRRTNFAEPFPRPPSGRIIVLRSQVQKLLETPGGRMSSWLVARAIVGN